MWHVKGYDSGSDEDYEFINHPSEGFPSEDKALSFAREQFFKIQHDHPSEEADHFWEPGVMQDKVVIIRPDGLWYYFEP